MSRLNSKSPQKPNRSKSSKRRQQPPTGQKSPQATAFAPATIGNVGIGFDILGMAIQGAGDEVQVSLRKDMQIIIHSITGREEEISPLPLVSEQNTAGAALLALQKGEQLKCGFDVAIHKGIPMGSGMGGSAASAVAAVVAANALLKKPLTDKQKLFYALEGEKVASGAAHPDNVAPCLLGGMTLASLHFKEPMQSLPFPKTMGWVLVHPNLKIETKQARAILSSQVALNQHVKQSANLAAFLAGLYKKDFQLIQQGLDDIIIEPQRAALIPGFNVIKKQVLSHQGVLGFSLSGSGPSVFALTLNLASAQKVSQLIKAEFQKINLEAESYYGAGPCSGAQILSSSGRKK